MIMPTEKLEDNVFDLRMFPHALFEKKWLILFISLLTCILSLTYSSFKPAKYQATVLLQVHSKQQNSLGSVVELEEPASVQIALIRSKFILDPVIKKLELAKHYPKNANYILNVFGTNAPKARPTSEIVNQIQSHLSIVDLSGSPENTDGKADILQLSFTDTRSDRAMKIINEIAIVTQEMDSQRKSMQAEKKLQFLYQQLPILQASLKDAEEKLNHYRATSGKIDIKLQTEYLFTHLTDIDKRLESIQLKKMGMKQQYTTYHPFVVAIDKQQKELENRRNHIIDQIKKLPASDQTAANLARDVSVKNKLYMILLNKIHEQQVTTAGITSDIQILALADSADMILPFRPIIIGFASLLIGFLLASLFVLIYVSLRTSHRF